MIFVGLLDIWINEPSDYQGVGSQMRPLEPELQLTNLNTWSIFQTNQCKFAFTIWVNLHNIQFNTMSKFGDMMEKCTRDLWICHGIWNETMQGLKTIKVKHIEYSTTHVFSVFSILFFSGLVFLVSCVFVCVLCIVPNVACTSGLSIFDFPFGTYWVHVLYMSYIYTMLMATSDL